MNWEKTLQIPKVPELSPEGIDLILKLCCGADKRLGRNGADEIKAHAFFASVCFDGNLRKQPAPYVPKIRYAADTSNFDAVDDLALEKPDPAPTSADSNGRHPEHAFFEFTFRRFFDGSGQPYPVGAGSAGGAAPGQEEGADGRGSPVYV